VLSYAAFVHLSSQEKPAPLKGYFYALPTHCRSADLLQCLLRVFTPEWVAAHDPAWMQKMIELHSPTHGRDY
jgi:hypothetical protein